MTTNHWTRRRLYWQLSDDEGMLMVKAIPPLYASGAPGVNVFPGSVYHPRNGQFTFGFAQVNYQPHYTGVLAWRFNPPHLIALAERPGNAYNPSVTIGPAPAEPHLWRIDVDLLAGGSVTAVTLPQPQGTRHTSKNTLMDGGWYEAETSQMTRVSRTASGFRVEVMLQYVRAGDTIGVEGRPTQYHHLEYSGTLTLTREGPGNWSSQTQQSSRLLGTWESNPGTTNADYWDPITGIPDNPYMRELYTAQAAATTPAAFMRPGDHPSGDPQALSWQAVPTGQVRQLDGTAPAGTRWHVALDPQQLRILGTPARITTGGITGTLTPTVGGGVAEFPEPVALTAGNLMVETPVPSEPGDGVQGWTQEMGYRYYDELNWWASYGSGWQIAARAPQNMRLVQPESVELRHGDSPWTPAPLSWDWRRIAELAAVPAEPHPDGPLVGVRFVFPARSGPHYWHVAWSAAAQGQPYVTVTGTDTGWRVNNLGWNAANQWASRPRITVEVQLTGISQLSIASVVEGEYT